MHYIINTVEKRQAKINERSIPIYSHEYDNENMIYFVLKKINNNIIKRELNY